MPSNQLNSSPMYFSPRSLSDALDSTEETPGCCASIQNLVFDPSTSNVLQCRPASIKRLATGFPNPITPFGFVSDAAIIGNIIYGLCATSRNVGHDEPFAFNLLTNAVIPVTGITAANTPVSPATSGDWTPPTHDLIGTKLVFTHPGFTLPKAFGWFDISDPLNPAWNAGNTAVTPLAAPPTAVAQFNGRAYYLVNPPGGQPGLYASDDLDPLTITNATFILTFGDNAPLTALKGLPLSSQLTGGVIQSVIVFKSNSQMVQVTGDPAANTAAGPWSKNDLNVATTTLAPRSVASTPQGLMFLSPQGLRLIDFAARVSAPIGANGQGVSVPFLNVPVPSRVAAAANASLYRVGLTSAQGQQQEFWYDLTRATWTGPHTFPPHWIEPYKNTFILAPLAIPNSLYQSDWLQNAGSTFVEAGLQMNWTYQTSMLPDTRTMHQHSMTETSVLFSSNTGATTTALDEGGFPIASVSLLAGGASSNWGNQPTSIWYQQTFALQPTAVPWTAPVNFGRLSLQMTGVSDSVTRIGAMTLRYEELGYLPQP